MKQRNSILRKAGKAFLLLLGLIAAAGVIFSIIDSIKNRKAAHRPYGLYERCGKRAVDFFCGMLALLIFWPLYLLVAVLVRVKLGAPVLFRQERPGRVDPKTGQETIFSMYKFRTMTDARDESGALLPDEVRLTKFGKLLRKTSLDELPEAFNIIKGDMSVIGPRPLLVKYLPHYTAEERQRHQVRPGLSGYAQVHGRNTVGWEEKFAMDVAYSRKITFLGDLKILLQTVSKALIRREGITSQTSATMEDFAEYRAAQNKEAS